MYKFTNFQSLIWIKTFIETMYCIHFGFCRQRKQADASYDETAPTQDSPGCWRSGEHGPNPPLPLRQLLFTSTFTVCCRKLFTCLNRFLLIIFTSWRIHLSSGLAFVLNNFCQFLMKQEKLKNNTCSKYILWLNSAEFEIKYTIYTDSMFVNEWTLGEKNTNYSESSEFSALLSRLF